MCDHTPKGIGIVYRKNSCHKPFTAPMNFFSAFAAAESGSFGPMLSAGCVAWYEPVIGLFAGFFKVARAEPGKL